MRGAGRYSPEEPGRAYVGRERESYKESGRMRTDWGLYEDPGHLRGGIYSVSDVAGVGVYRDVGGDDVDVADVERREEKVYGFSPPAAPRLSSSSGKWSSSHSLAAASSPTRSVHSVSATTGGHRSSLGDSHRPASYVRDSLKRHDYSRHHHHQPRTTPADAIYRSVNKRTGDRLANGGGSSRSQQQPSRSYSATSRGDYSTSSAGYRSLRGYSAVSEDYEDREPRSFDNSALSNGYSARLTDYSSRGNSLKRSSNKDYLNSSEVYSSRRSFPSESHPSRSSATKGILTNSSKYSGGSRSSICTNYNSDSRNNLSGFSGLNDDGKSNLSAPTTFDRRGSSSYVSRASVSTATKGSQTEVSTVGDRQSIGKASLQVPEGVSSGSSRRSSSSTQQVTFSTAASGAGSDTSQQDGKEDRYDTLSRRHNGTLRSDREKVKKTTTKDEQNQTEDDMSHWGGGGGQWNHNHDQHHSDGTTHTHAHHLQPPLPRPPLPPQHYPGHDSQPQGHPPSIPGDHSHYNHAYHNHGHNHVHHTHHSKQPSSSSRQPLVHAESMEGKCTCVS